MGATEPLHLRNLPEARADPREVDLHYAGVAGVDSTWAGRDDRGADTRVPLFRRGRGISRTATTRNRPEHGTVLRGRGREVAPCRLGKIFRIPTGTPTGGRGPDAPSVEGGASVSPMIRVTC